VRPGFFIMSTLLTRSATCPVCNHAFDYGVPLSTNAAGGVETDFRARPVGLDPLPLTVLTCGRCSYSADTGAFEQPVAPAAAYQLKALADQLFTATPVPHSRRFQLAATLMEIGGRSPSDIGWMYLRAAWLARDEAIADAEALYQRRALEAFQKHLADEPHAVDAGQITYLVGELARRLADFETACTHLARVPRQERLYPTAQKMLARAREQDASPARFGE
jgi:uncharacterized protein (DUF2225 family)